MKSSLHLLQVMEILEIIMTIRPILITVTTRIIFDLLEELWKDPVMVSKDV